MTILCEPDPQAAGYIASILPPEVQIVTSLPAAAMTLAADSAQRLVVIGTGIPFRDVLDFCPALRDEYPGTAVILLRDRDIADVAAAAVAAGVRAVVPAHDGAAVLDACRRAVVGEPPAPVPVAAPRHDGKVVTVFSAKGGTGKTTIATNLAVVLAGEGAHRVCLVDLDLQFGDVAISMALTPTRTIIDMVEAGKADTTVLERMLTPYRPGLDCILAPIEPGDAERVPPDLVRDLLLRLSRTHDYIVVDTPSQLSEHVLCALDAARHHILLTSPEIPSLKNLRLTLDMLDLLGYDRQARTIVCNRTDARGGLSIAEVETALKARTDAHVPSSPDVPASINQGVPITVLDPEHPVSEAIRRFAGEAITGEPTSTERRAARRGLRRRIRST